MRTNKWEELAKLFNLVLDEEFYIKQTNNKEKYTHLYKFTEDGLQILVDGAWRDRHSALYYLLTGSDEIVYIPFKPKTGDIYWCLSYAEPIEQYWNGDHEDLTFWKCGNCFRTKEEAEVKGKELMEQIRKEYENE